MTLTMDPSTSSGSVKEGSVSSGVPGEQLTELGANLRRALDGQLADERATGPPSSPPNTSTASPDRRSRRPGSG